MLGTGSFAVLALGSLLKGSPIHARKVRQHASCVQQLLWRHAVSGLAGRLAGVCPLLEYSKTNAADSMVHFHTASTCCQPCITCNHGPG
jgi:hypothetical protein